MMNNEKAKWILALQSGKYAQTTGALFVGTGLDAPRNPHNMSRAKTPGFCCLGVAIQELDPMANCKFFFHEDVPEMRSNTSECLSNYGRRVLNLCEDDEETLIELNDSGFTFRQIADLLIDQSLCGLPLKDMVSYE